MFRSDGADGAEAVVGLGRCDTCSVAQPAPKPFLTVEQTQQVLDAFIPRTPSGIVPCTSNDVKLIPAPGSPSEVTGARGLWIEIHASNPRVDCLATAPSSVSFADADGKALGFLLRAGVYQGTGLDTSGLEITQEAGPARFALTKYRCDEAGATPAATALVTFEGWAAPVAVQLPPWAGIERCVGDQQAAGNTVWVSGLDG